MLGISPLSPYLLWIKLGLIVALIGGVFFGGYHMGHNRGTEEGDVRVAKVQHDFDTAQKAWADEKTVAASQAIAALKNAERENDAKEAAAQHQIDAITIRYQSATKELENARNKVLAQATHHSDPAVPALPSDGLWVDTEVGSCTANSDGDHSVPQATQGGRGVATQRCRLSDQTATRLVDFAADANAIVLKYNECVGSLRTAVDGPAPAAAPEPEPAADSTSLTRPDQGTGP